MAATRTIPVGAPSATAMRASNMQTITVYLIITRWIILVWIRNEQDTSWLGTMEYWRKPRSGGASQTNQRLTETVRPTRSGHLSDPKKVGSGSCRISVSRKVGKIRH